MTFKQVAIGRCREFRDLRDAAKSLEAREHYASLLDAAVLDLVFVTRWYRKAAKLRLKQIAKAA